MIYISSLVKRNMKILLINARFPGYHGRDMFPIGLGCLAGIAEKIAETSVIDLNVQTDEELSERLSSFDPDMVGISATTPSYPSAVSILKEVKKLKNIPVIIGGSHVSFKPDDTLRDGFDIVIRGEGGDTFKEILSSSSLSDLEKIKGISFLKDKKIIHAPDREMTEDLDSLPLPAYKKFPLEKYEILSIITSRGCPYRCAYCCASKFWKNRIRFRSIENVVQELKIIKSLGVKRIKFHDSTFTFDKKRVIELCKRMKEEGLTFKWSCETRADNLDEELLKIMKDAGCILICIGVDSVCYEVLDAIKRNISLEKIKETFLLAGKIGIRTRAYITFGLPEETEKSVLSTIAFLKETRPNQIMLSLATAYPGTDLVSGKKVRFSPEWKKKFDGHGFGSELYLPKTLNRQEYMKLADYLWTEIRKMKKLFK